MLKISQLERALAYQKNFGNASDADHRPDNTNGKPNLPGTRAARILGAQTESTGTMVDSTRAPNIDAPGGNINPDK